MLGHYRHEDGLFWFGADGTLVLVDFGQVQVGSWKADGDGIVVGLDGQEHPSPVFRDEHGHLAFLVDQLRIGTRFEPGWTAEELREALKRPWRQLFSPSGEHVYFRPWAPKLDVLGQRADELELVADGAVIRNGGEGAAVLSLNDGLLVLHDDSVHFWTDTTELSASELSDLRERVLGDWQLVLPPRQLAHVHFALGPERASFAVPKGSESVGWRVDADGRHLILDESFSLLVLGRRGEPVLAMPDQLLSMGTVLTRVIPASVDDWVGDWTVVATGALDDSVTEFTRLPTAPGVFTAGPELSNLLWSPPREARWTMRRDGTVEIERPDGSTREGDWSVRGGLLTVFRAPWRQLPTHDPDVRVLLSPGGELRLLARRPVPPLGREAFVGTWKVMSWGWETDLMEHVLLPAPTLTLHDDGTFVLEVEVEGHRFEGVPDGSGAWTSAAGHLDLEGIDGLTVAGIGPRALTARTVAGDDEVVLVRVGDPPDLYGVAL